MGKGIILLAHGHPNYYRMALNCAVSIKATSEIAVALVHGSDYTFTKEELSYFDLQVSIAKENILLNGEVNYALLKLNMYDLSPFEETLYPDADSLALYGKNLENLFSEASLRPVQFDIDNVGHSGENEKDTDFVSFSMPNGSWKKIRETYSIPAQQQIYDIQSTLVYFKKGAIAKSFFETAIRVFKENKLSISENSKSWVNDELSFMIAQGIEGLEMQVPFSNVYYPMTEGFIGSEEQLDKILREYYFYSIPGIHSHEVFINFYNELVKEYYRHEKLDTSRMFLYQNKREYMPERVSL